MQEFLTNNTVNCNLMSLTGYRTLVILGLLMESPKTIDEINNYFFDHQYIKERFSKDTIRIYINSLRAIGCEIIRAGHSCNVKYELISHPFEYDIPPSQLKALAKVYKAAYDKINIQELMGIERIFGKLLPLLKNETTKESLLNGLVLKNIKEDVLKNLLKFCKNKNQITFLYDSPKSGPKEINIVADKLSFKSEKLYLWGNNLTHNEYSYFLVEKIIEIYFVKLLKDKTDFPSQKFVYELYNANEDYIPESDEKIIEKTNDKLVIELNSKNEFNVMQRLLYKADNCKIIYPESFKKKLLDKLRAMKEYYENI